MDSMWKFLTDTWTSIGGDYVSDAIGTGYNTVTDYFTDDAAVGLGGNRTYDVGGNSTLKSALSFAGGFMDVIAPNDGKPIQHAKANLRSISGRSRLRSPKFKSGDSNLGFTPRVTDAIARVNASKNPSIKMITDQMRSYNGSGRTIRLAGSSSISVGNKNKMPSFAPKYYGK
tara:strand:- start:1193 stop:1708 length:516 start_codon:yes stop_codon:yes gene_type:complete